MKRPLAFLSLLICTITPHAARADTPSAAKALAATMVDLHENAEQRAAIANEFEEQTEGFKLKFYITEGPPPVPND
jgi:hypothetical protein